MKGSNYLEIVSVIALGLNALPARAQVSTNGAQLPVMEVHARGILVGAPKIYDDYYLQTLLASLKNNLAAVKAVDQATLLGHIGNVQGGDLRQTSVAVSGSGLPTAQTSSFTLAPGVPAFMVPPLPSGATTPATATATATTPGTTVTQNSATPVAPTPPAPTLALPSFGQSSLDTLNESLQLSSEIMNVELMLDGAFTDRLQRTNGRSRATYTIGFPVTIESPRNIDKQHENEVAEIQVKVCLDAALPEDPPSIVNLVPKEKTYNVASLVDRSFLGSLSAVLGGVFNVGGAFFFSHKTFYLVQQQETVAFQKDADRCDGEHPSRSVNFAWQVRPVLGSKHVRPGMTQEFVQVSGPFDFAQGEKINFGKVYVTAGWRKTSDKGNLMGELQDAVGPVVFDLPKYSTIAKINRLAVRDIGQGNVSVQVYGTFLPGVMVRVGTSVALPIVSSEGNSLTFVAAAQDLVRAGGAALVSRGLEDIAVVNEQAPSCPDSVGPSGDKAARTCELTIPKEGVIITPYSDSQVHVKLRFTPADGLISSNNQALNPWVVTIGDKVFGLRDNPFQSFEGNVVEFNAPKDLLRSNPRIELRKLLWPDNRFRAFYALTEAQFPLAGPSVSKVSTASSDSGLNLFISGSALDRSILKFPVCKNCTESIGSAYLSVSIPKEQTKGLKQVVICQGAADKCDNSFLPIVLDIPKDEDAKKPGLKVEGDVTLTAKTIQVSGDAVGKVALVEFEKAQVNFRLSTDEKPKLVVDLPAAVAGVPGTFVLVFTFEDKTTQVLPVTIKKG